MITILDDVFGHKHRRHPHLLGLCAGIMASLLLLSAAQARNLQLVALGDSLSAGYELSAKDAFPAVLERALRAKGLEISVENAGVSGDTATGGFERLDWSVPDGTDGVILELGANDALRGIDPAITQKALESIILRLKERKIAVFLAGMRAPRNNGADYTKAFDAIFPALAQKHATGFYPFFLDGVAGNPSLNLKDMMHPNPQGVEVIVSRMLPSVEAWISTLNTP